MIDRQPVEPACNRLLLVQARCVIPCRDLGFDLRIVRPAIQLLIAVAANEPGRWRLITIGASSRRGFPRGLLGGANREGPPGAGAWPISPAPRRRGRIPRRPAGSGGSSRCRPR